MNNNNSSDKIYYPCYAKFIIHPPLEANDKILLCEYITRLKEFYQKDSKSIFFWYYNDDSIYVDPSTDFVDNDILHQLTLVAFWLFSKNYLLEGEFFYQINGLVGYIICYPNNKSITYSVIFDKTQLDDTNERILFLAAKKVFKYRQKFLTNLFGQEINRIDNINQSLVETNQQIKCLDRNIWKMFTIVGLFSIGIFIVQTLC